MGRPGEAPAVVLITVLLWPLVSVALAAAVAGTEVKN